MRAYPLDSRQIIALQVEVEGLEEGARRTEALKKTLFPQQITV